ncbi:hypothetical protein ACI79C_07015 [Geodermatophilus sp. SYSU D00697]
MESLTESLPDALRALAEDLDALAAEDPAPLSGPALLVRLCGLLNAQNRIAAEVLAPCTRARAPARRRSTGR